MSGLVLVTGGAGYIGSHVCKALKKAGYSPIAFDNLSGGHRWAVRYGPFCQGDLQNPKDLDRVFSEYELLGVIHMAGSINLRESFIHPDRHYLNNVVGTLSLLQSMVKQKVSSIVFSSSAAVYQQPSSQAIDESHPKEPTSPYGKTKWMVEQILSDFERAYGIRSIALRYFNAAGADPEGEIGEAHLPETHLIPLLLMAATGKKEHFHLFNNELPTPDGTAIRDYVHVTDLAQGHVAALQWLQEERESRAFNLGSESGKSILEVIECIREMTGSEIPVQIQKQSRIEPPILIADSTRAKKDLGWSPQYSNLESIIETALRWHQNSSPLVLSK